MLTESMEDYLETIYRLAAEKGYVRAVDVSENLGIQASSVTRMIQRLHAMGFLRYEKYRNMDLTPAGQAYGRFLVWRDQTLVGFLSCLAAGNGIKQQVEGIEHYITPVTMGLIRNLNRFFAENPQALAELHRLRQIPAYPDEETLIELRAWSYRHDLGEF